MHERDRPGRIGTDPTNRRATRPQAGLSRRARLDNVRGSIRFREKEFDCQHARVLLVDDILTSGATCNEAAKALLGAGASQVYVAVLARAEGPG